MNVEPTNYIIKLKTCYKYLAKSRVVNRRETDDEALEYFQRFCNDAIPKTDNEIQFRDAIRDLYYADKTSFLKCAIKHPYFILLTESRTIVIHFNIQDIIFIKWDGSQYTVQKNDLRLVPKKYLNKNM